MPEPVATPDIIGYVRRSSGVEFRQFRGHDTKFKGYTMTKRDFPPIHPGEILLTEFLEPLGVPQYRLAKDVGVTPRRINEIVHGRRAITADTALRLGRFFNMEAQFWLNLQTHYDMEVALDLLQDRLDKEVHPLSSAA